MENKLVLFSWKGDKRATQRNNEDYKAKLANTQNAVVLLSQGQPSLSVRIKFISLLLSETSNLK